MFPWFYFDDQATAALTLQLLISNCLHMFRVSVIVLSIFLFLFPTSMYKRVCTREVLALHGGTNDFALAAP